MKSNNPGVIAWRVVLTLMLGVCMGLMTWTANTCYSSSIRLSVIETTLKDELPRMGDDFKHENSWAHRHIESLESRTGLLEAHIEGVWIKPKP